MGSSAYGYSPGSISDCASGTGGVSSHAITIQNLVETTKTGGLSVSPSGPTMLAEFRPNFGATLEQVANIGGFDHFNWAQYVLEYPGFLIGANGAIIDDPFLTLQMEGSFGNQRTIYRSI